MHTAVGRFAVASAVFALAACSDHVDPTAALAPGATDSSIVSLSATANVPECGFENGAACAPLDDGARCDAGLALDRNGTPLNTSDDRCVNDTRHLAGAEFRDGWVAWALRNQRTLAIDEPINWVMHLSTHNAYNNAADGYILDPNQVWSISDQLDLGSRFLWLDIYWRRDAVRMCHAVLCGTEDRRFAYGIQEIAAWLGENDDEIVMIDLEAYAEGQYDAVADPLREFFGARLFRPGDKVGSRWPSRREMLAMGKQVIVGARGDTIDLGADSFRGTVHPNYIDGRQDIRFVKNFEVTRTNGVVTSCGGRKVDDDGAGLQPLGINDHTFWVVGEDRTVAGLFVNTGYVEPSDVVDMVACNLPLISLDLLSFARCATVPKCTEGGDLLQRAPAEERQPYAVWSWRSGDRGDAGDAALLHGSDGRWTSAAPAGSRRYACARPRSETSRDPADWEADRLGAEWRVTTREGPWRGGGRACLDEYGDEGFVFSTPVNGRMNGSLRLADASRGDVWVNYNDIKQEGQWVINRRPVANAGVDRVVECNGHNGTSVQLDGTASRDPDGDQLSFEWQGPFGTATGAQPTVLLPLGTHVIRVIADDGFGGVQVDEVVIQIVDTTPPEIRSATATPSELWPPNHKMVPVEVTVDVHDLCDPTPTCRIVSVTSDEPVNGSGDGNTVPDWEITGALTVSLRAERSGNADGRVYTITVECVDDSGNAATTTVTVTVSHDQGAR